LSDEHSGWLPEKQIAQYFAKSDGAAKFQADVF